MSCARRKAGREYAGKAGRLGEGMGSSFVAIFSNTLSSFKPNFSLAVVTHRLVAKGLLVAGSRV